jgi:hypothetical protein
MGNTFEQILVMVIVGISAIFLLKKLVRTSKAKGCTGCGCSKPNLLAINKNKNL